MNVLPVRTCLLQYVSDPCIQSMRLVFKWSASMSESLSFNFAINVSEWTNIVLFAIRKMFTDMLALKCRVYYALKRASNVFE